MNWLDIYLNKSIVREAILSQSMIYDKINISEFLIKKGFDLDKAIYRNISIDEIIYTQKINYAGT